MIDGLKVTINEFKALKGYWVVYWIGLLSKHEAQREYLIEVVLVPIGRNLQEYDRFSSIGASKFRDSIRVSITYTPFLMIGSIWKDGKFYASPSSRNEKIEIKLNKPLLLKGEYIKDILKGSKIDNYPFISGYYNFFISTNEKTSDIPIGIDYVLFPCFEIARKYHLKSDALAKKVFAGEIGSREIYYGSETEQGKLLEENTSEIKHVVLTKHMYDTDAPFVARIMYDARARNSAGQISNVLTKGKDRTVDCFFPFEGGSVLKVTGERLITGGKTYFLVFQIISCSALFFEGELKFARANDGREVDNPDFQNLTENNAIKNVKGNNTDSPNTLTFTDKPNYQSITEKINYQFDDEFPGKPKSGKMTKEELNSRNKEINYLDEPVEMLSTNTTSSNNSKTGSAGTVSQNKADIFSTFIEALRVLDNNGYNTEPVSCTSQYHGNNSYFYFEHEPIDNGNWCFLNKIHKNNWQNPRACMIAKFEKNGRYFYILEIQRRPNSTEAFCTYVMYHPESKLNETDIFLLLNEIAVNNGAVGGNKEKGKFKSLNGKVRYLKIRHSATNESSENPSYLHNRLKKIF